MLKKPLFLEMFVLLATVELLNYIAVVYHLYWTANEFDSLVHFFGGTAVSAFFLWLYFFSGFFKPSKRKLAEFLLVSLLGTIFIATCWEVYELFLGEILMNNHYPSDTAFDFIMALLGATAVCFYGYIRELQNKKTQENTYFNTY